MNKIKQSHFKSTTKIAAALLLSVFAVTAIIGISNNKTVADSYTICADEEYYSETTYYLSQSAFKEHLSNSSSNKKSYSTADLSLTSDDNNEEFVLGVSKSVWVAEEINEENVITSSHLLSKEEIDNIGITANTFKLGPFIEQKPLPNDGSGDIVVGTEEMLYGCLTIDLTVLFDTTNDTYKIEGNSSWEQNLTLPWEGNNEAESFHEDYMALTWGGDKTLAAQNRNITGEYYGGDTVEFRQSASDTYSGYVWYFIEQNGFFGKELENAKATATLKKVGESEGKETNAKLTYVHTYGELELGVGIGITTTGLAPSITVGASESYWQIEIDVSGIEY